MKTAKNLANFNKNTAETMQMKQKQKEFYWPTLLISAIGVATPILFLFPLLSSNKKIPLTSYEDLANAYSAFGLMFSYPIATVFGILALIAASYLVFVGVFASLSREHRSVKTFNLLFVPGLVASILFNGAALVSSLFETEKEVRAYLMEHEPGSGILESNFIGFASPTFWIAIALPLAIAIWWIAVNYINYKKTHQDD